MERSGPSERARRCAVAGTKWVYDFSEGNKEQKNLLGGKGANLAEMTNLGLPVPPGFTITTDACRFYLEHGTTPPDLGDEVTEHLDRKSTRLNSSHVEISYAVFCLKKKK